jgi:hypothetical protein
MPSERAVAKTTSKHGEGSSAQLGGGGEGEGEGEGEGCAGCADSSIINNASGRRRNDILRAARHAMDRRLRCDTM